MLLVRISIRNSAKYIWPHQTFLMRQFNHFILFWGRFVAFYAVSLDICQILTGLTQKCDIAGDWLSWEILKVLRRYSKIYRTPTIFQLFWRLRRCVDENSVKFYPIFDIFSVLHRIFLWNLTDILTILGILMIKKCDIPKILKGVTRSWSYSKDCWFSDDF